MMAFASRNQRACHYELQANDVIVFNLIALYLRCP